jgi:uncharacterized protein involved in exopolysaccharide biosynthesis
MSKTSNDSTPLSTTDKAPVAARYGAVYEIDLAALSGLIWQRKMMVAKTTAVAILLGLLVAFGSPVEFNSQVDVMPELSQPRSLGGLGSLARQFGVTGAQNRMDGIAPELYADIAKDPALMQRLLAYEIVVPGTRERVTLFDYFDNVKRDAPIDLFFNYTVMLPLTVIDWLRPVGQGLPADHLQRMYPDKIGRLVSMGPSEWDVVDELGKRISASMSRETGVVRVNVKMPDAVMAADVADQVVVFLKEYITDYRTEKARTDLDFAEARYAEARARYEHAQERLALFRNENRGELTTLARTREQQLQGDFDLQFTLYKNMAERLEEARLKLQENTPVVTVISPAAIPGKKSEPRRALILMMFVIAGLGVAVVRLLVRPQA